MKTTRSTLLILALSAMGIGLVIVMGVRLGRVAQKEIVTRFSQHQLLLAEQTAASVQSIFDEARRDLLHIKEGGGPNCLANALGAENQEQIAACRGVTEQSLFSYLQSHPIYAQIRYIDASGQEIVGVDSDGETVRIIPQDQLRSQAEREIFVATKQLDAGEVYVSPLEPALGHGEVMVGHWTVRLVAPVLDSLGQRQGIVVLNLLGDEIRGRLAVLGTEEGMDAWVLDETGLEIINVAHPELKGSNAYEYCQQTGDETLIALTEDMLAGGRGTGTYLWPESEGGPPVVKKLMAYAPIYPAEGHVWSVGTSVTYDSILAAHRQTRTTLVFLGGSIIAIILAGAVLAARSGYKQAMAEEQAHLSETQRRRGEELDALREISLAVTAQLGLDEVLQNVVERGCRLLDARAGGIYLVDETRSDLEFVVSHGYTRDYVGTRLASGEGLCGRVLQSGAPLAVADYNHWEGRSPDWETETLTAVLGVPLKRGEQVIGVLEFVESGRARGFGEHDVWLATLFANQAAIAIENARLYQAAQAARESADTLREISRAVGSTLELDEVLSLVLRQAKRVLTYDTASILLFAGGEPAMAAVSGYEDEKLVRTEVSLRLNDSPILQAMACDHSPVVIADVREDERWIWVPGAEEVRAWIAVPLLARDEMTGALMIDSTQPGFYTEADVIIAQALANQAAVAIENARLYQAEQRGREIAEALQETARVVNTSLNLEEVLPLILEQLAQVIEYDSSAVLLLDDDWFKVTAGRGFPDLEAALRISFNADGDNISSAVMHARRPLIIEDVQADPRWRPDPGVTHIHGWIGAPLIARDRVTGILNVDSCQIGAYSEEDGQLVFAFAAQAAIAIENARLYEQAQRRLESLTSLSRASQAITGSLDVQDVLEQIVGLAGTVVNSDYTSVVLLDKEGQPVLGTGDFRGIPPVAQRIRSNGVARHVLDSGQPVVLDAISGEGTMSPPLRRSDGELMEANPDIVAAGIHSFAAVPIQARGRMLGVLFVHSRQPRAFHGQLPLLTTFANQVAIAIENARLFEAERRRRQEAETLRETALALTTSLDRNQVIERILIKLREVVPYDSASVQLLWDDHLEIIGGHGFPNLEELVGVTFDLTDGDNPNREVMHTRAPFILEDAPAVYSEFGREPHAQAAIYSWLGVPMLVGDQPVGMIALDRHEPGFYTQEHARLAEAFAAQAAIAIENARLYEEAKRHLDEAMLIQEVMLATASTLDFALAFERTVKALHRVLGIDRIGFLLPSEQDDWLARHPSLVGLMESAIQIPIEGSLVGRAYRTGQPVLVQDVTRESAYLARAPEVRSELAVPVRSGDRVVAVLHAESPQVGAFSEDELRLFITVAGQLGVALDKARLYRELRNHAEQLEQRVQERTAQLQAQYARQDAVLRSASDGIVVTDARGAILQTNPVAQAWLAQTLSPDDAARLQEAVRDVAQRAEEQPETVLELTGLDLELRAAPVLEPGTDEAATVVAIHDVSHLKTLDRMKSRFISNVSHELRTPVTTIKLYTALLQQASPEKWGKYLETMEREVEQLACLVEDILQISHIDAGWMEIKPRPTSINELTETATVRHQTLAQDRRLTLEHRPAEPGPVALVDPEQTMQVLNNLVMNAIQYTPGGGQIVVSTGKQKANGRVWSTVAVADTGIGIPEEELPRIFDRFFRGEEPRLMQVPGTGLGLAIAKSVVELHGGRVTVESQVGEGTTFTVWLPLA